MQENLKKVYIGIAVVVAALVLLNIAGFVFNLRSGPPREWMENVFAGRVSAISSDSVSVIDANATVKSFVVTPRTRVMEGRKNVGIEELSLGLYVIVHSAPRTENEEEAREIRFLTTGPYNGATSKW